MTVDERLKELGIELPGPRKPGGTIEPLVVSGKTVYVSGQGPITDGKALYQGVVGRDVSEQEGYDAARLCAINALGALKAGLGGLDRVARVVKVLGFVASAPDFYGQPAVMNGASELLLQVLGERGRHARSALGTSVLPGNIPVEVEFIFELAE